VQSICTLRLRWREVFSRDRVKRIEEMELFRISVVAIGHWMNPFSDENADEFDPTRNSVGGWLDGLG